VVKSRGTKQRKKAEEKKAKGEVSSSLGGA
jgi:hypothetical protein